MRPITPQPGYTEADLHALLATRQFAYTDCFSIINKDLETLRYCTTQKDVTIEAPVEDTPGPVIFSSNTVKVSGLQLEIGVGVEVDEQTLRMDYASNYEYRGLPFSTALRFGRFDGGTIRRDRYFTDKLGNPWIAGVPLFVGKTSTADKIGRSFAILKVKSDLVLLKMPMPRKLFQPQCLHTLFDPGCGLDKSAYEVSATAGVGSTAELVKWAGATAGFQGGTIYMEDAGGVTLVRTIESVGDGGVHLAYPLEFVPPPGTHFKAYPGCIRTYARCGEFSNQDNYQGFPFIPVAETAY